MRTPRLARFLPCLLMLSSFAAVVEAATPSMTAVRPLGGRRGSKLEVTLSGDRLGDAQEVLFHQPGIKTKKIQVVNNNAVKVTFEIAPDARLGLYDLRLRTSTGISETRTFSVGALQEVNEVEPNSDFAKPQAIPFESVVNGVADNEDVDFYEFTAKKGDRITAEVEGIRNGLTLFDPYVAIMDSKRFELASSDDSALVWQDGFASVIAPEDGKYIVQVRESAYAGNGGCLYRLHIGRFPRATATVPLGGKLGEKVEVRWIGDVTGEKTSAITLPAAFDRNFGIVHQDDRGLSPSSNLFRLSTFGNVVEAEPNDDQAKATPFAPPLAVNGVIGKAGDTDYYVFSAKKGQTFDIRMFARQLRSPLDPVLHVVKKGGAYLAGSDDAVGPDSYIRFGAPEDGEYCIYIHDHLLKGGSDYAYRVEVTPIEPRLSLSVPNESLARGTGTINAPVPKGNRFAVLLNAGRADFGGELKLIAQNLPPGIEMEADTMAASIGTMPVLFRVKPDAALAGGLISIRGEHVDPNVKVPSEFTQTIELVLGQNNIPFWTRTVETFPVAVTDEAPYSIEIVEPKVPIVRGGSMGLKVIAKRKEGFTTPISVFLPWNPPGISSAGGIVIPEKQNEAVIPINADGGAELRTWKIVVNGASSAPSGPITVSSQLAKLTVAQQFLTLAFQAASVEQGKDVDLSAAINKAVDFPGEAQVTLLGLPNKVVTDVKKITKDSKDLVFKLKTDLTSPAGNHVNLFCQVVVTQNGEPIVHNLGTGQLRIDVPLPPKPNAPAVAAAPATPAPAPPPTAAPAKPPTRLEKLRSESRERAKAAAGL